MTDAKDPTRPLNSSPQAPMVDVTCRQPDLRWDSSDLEDPDDAGWAYDDMVSELTELMNTVDLYGSLHCEVKNFGWRHLDGHKDFNAHTGRELLQAVLPRTDCTFSIWLNSEEKKLIIENAHHDAPTGGEFYTITLQEES